MIAIDAVDRILDGGGFVLNFGDLALVVVDLVHVAVLLSKANGVLTGIVAQIFNDVDLRVVGGGADRGRGHRGR